MTWSDPEPSEYVRLLVYSMPGWGKTTSLLTAPQPVRSLDPENSSLALAGVKHDRDIKIKRITKFMDCQVALQELKDEKVSGGTVVFDTLTQIQRAHLRELAGSNPPQQRDYSVDTYGLGRAYTAFASLPMNVLYFCGLDTVKVGEAGNQTLIAAPDLTPSLLKDLMQVCDGVGFAYLDVQGNRCITFEPGRTHWAKRRHIAIPKGVILADKNVEGIGKVIDWEGLLSKVRASNQPK